MDPEGEPSGRDPHERIQSADRRDRRNDRTRVPEGYIPAGTGVGCLDGTFDESPRVQLLTGASAEDYCAANPDDPVDADPGSAPLR